MDQVGHPCVIDPMMVVHYIAAVFIGFNTLLTTWLTLRAKRRDKKEADDESHPVRRKPSA